MRDPQINDPVIIEAGKHAGRAGIYVRNDLIQSGQKRIYPVVRLSSGGEVRVVSVAPLTFAKGVTCGGCGEILPDQEIASDCLCDRLRAIECLCPDTFRDNGLAVDYCPSDGKERQANEQEAERRGPWYGQPALVTGSNPSQVEGGEPRG